MTRHAESSCDFGLFRRAVYSEIFQKGLLVDRVWSEAQMLLSLFLLNILRSIAVRTLRVGMAGNRKCSGNSGLQDLRPRKCSILIQHSIMSILRQEGSCSLFGGFTTMHGRAKKAKKAPKPKTDESDLELQIGMSADGRTAQFTIWLF